MSISRVWIEKGCTSCGLCEALCPEVFRIEGEATVIEGVDYDSYETQIIEAAENCPSEVIKYEQPGIA